MGNSALQALVKAHHNGQHNRHDYRRLRRELIDKLVEQYEASQTGDDPTTPATLPRYTVERRRPPAPPPARQPKIGLIALLAILAIALGAAVLYFSHLAPGTDHGLGDVKPAALAQSPSPTTSAPWLEEFIAAPAWEPPRIDAFLRQWQSLAAGQRQTLRQTPQFHRLMDVLSHQLAEQRALAELNNDQARQQAQRLRDLQQSLQQ